jgi:hypothetical protein
VRLDDGESPDIDDSLPYVPSDVAYERIVRPGDRVAITGTFDMREDPTPRASLRDPARQILVLAGTPVLAVLSA